MPVWRDNPEKETLFFKHQENNQVCSYSTQSWSLLLHLIHQHLPLPAFPDFSPSRFSALDFPLLDFQHKFSSHSLLFLDGRIFIPAFNSCKLRGALCPSGLPRLRLLFLSLSAPGMQKIRIWRHGSSTRLQNPTKSGFTEEIRGFGPLWEGLRSHRSSGVERSSVWTLILSARAIGII